MNKSTNYFLRLVSIALFLGLLLAFILVVVAEWDGEASQAYHNAFGHLTALLILVLFTGLTQRFGRGAIGLVLGKDNRVSTSKLQVVVWTYAIAGAMLSLIAATWVGSGTGFEKLADPQFDVEDYLILLGGPFAAAVTARYVIGSKVDRGELSKPPAATPAAGQAVTDDAGSADLIDVQYLLFNLVAVVFFVGAFVRTPTDGLPDIPTVLFSLTSASALTYVANKAVATGVPTITGLSPQKGSVGTVIELFGTNLHFPVDGAVSDDPHAPRVTIDGVPAPPVPGSSFHAPTGDDRLKVTVPSGVSIKPVNVIALNFRGVASNPMPFEVGAPSDPTRNPADATPPVAPAADVPA